MMNMHVLALRLAKIEAQRAAEAAPDNYVVPEPDANWLVQFYKVVWELRGLLEDIGNMDRHAPNALLDALENLHEWQYTGPPAELANAPGMAALLKQVRAEE